MCVHACVCVPTADTGFTVCGVFAYVCMFTSETWGTQQGQPKIKDTPTHTHMCLHTQTHTPQPACADSDWAACVTVGCDLDTCRDNRFSLSHAHTNTHTQLQMLSHSTSHTLNVAGLSSLHPDTDGSGGKIPGCEFQGSRRQIGIGGFELNCSGEPGENVTCVISDCNALVHSVLPPLPPHLHQFLDIFASFKKNNKKKTPSPLVGFSALRLNSPISVLPVL